MRVRPFTLSYFNRDNQKLSQSQLKQRMLRKKTPKESEEQEKIFTWAKKNEKEFPHLELLNASLMGVKLTVGQLKKAARMGCKKSFPDISLPVARCGYSGLFIELKRVRFGHLSDGQADVLLKLNRLGGNLAVSIKGAEESIRLIIAYLQNNREVVNQIIGCDHD